MKRSIGLIIALILIISTGIVFAEIEDYEKSWAKDEISYMISKGIISGYPDGTFRPDNNMSRVEFYTVINGLVGYSEKGEVDYEDVNSEDWYYEEVQKASKANYLAIGKTLGPNEKITRGEIVKIVGKIFDIEEDILSANKFVDGARLPKEIKGSVGGLKKNGYITGYPDGTFRHESESTRAEVVKILHNVLEEALKADKEVEIDEDNKKELKEEKEEITKPESPVIEDEEDIEDRKHYTRRDEIEIFIHFNNPVDRDRAEDPTNYLFKKEKDGKIYDLTDLNGEAIVDSDGKRVILKLLGFKDEGYKFLEISPALRDKDNNRLGEDRFFDIIDDEILVPSQG